MNAYDPNDRWGTHTVELHLMMWEQEARVTTTIGGNCRGFSILEDALERYADQLYDEQGEQPTIILTSKQGDEETRLHCSPEDESIEEWLRSMCVGVRILSFEPQPSDRFLRPSLRRSHIERTTMTQQTNISAWSCRRGADWLELRRGPGRCEKHCGNHAECPTSETVTMTGTVWMAKPWSHGERGSYPATAQITGSREGLRFAHVVVSPATDEDDAHEYHDVLVTDKPDDEAFRCFQPA